jgi:hypothetical protein
MTLIDKQLNATVNNEYAYLFYLINPVSGANNVVVSSSSVSIRSVSASYHGVRQTSQPDASSKATTTATTSQTLGTTIVTGNSWLVSFAQGDAAAPTAGTGVTSVRGTETNVRVGDSNAGLGTGVNSMTWTNGSNMTFNVIQASIAPAPDAGGAFLFNMV